ncbi:MAG: hypothetical protein FJW31_10185 [Acidobacteria bacterium]|nr:hypothetical protein [Acidobacteriota bacterium]
MRLQLRSDTDSGVGHGKTGSDQTVRARLELHGQDDAAAGGEFERIVDEIEQDLTEPYGVRKQPWRVRRRLEPQVEPLLSRSRAQQLNNIFHHRGRV